MFSKMSVSSHPINLLDQDYEEYADNGMAERYTYNAHKHGLINLAPERDEPGFSDAGATTIESPANDKGYTFGQPSNGRFFGFAFTVSGAPQITPVQQLAPSQHARPFKPQKKTGRYSAAEEALKFSLSRDGVFHREKRKPIPADTGADDEKTTDEPPKKKRRYMPASDPDSLVDADPNTNGNSYKQVRRPKRYSRGTSIARRYWRKAKSLLPLLPNPWANFFPATIPAAEPIPEFAFDEKAYLVQPPPPTEVYMHAWGA